MSQSFQTTQSIQLVEEEQGGPQVTSLYQAITDKLGKVPNVMKVLANAPHVLQGVLALDGAIGGGTLPAALKNNIALAVSQKNECDYCLSAFTAIGESLNTPTEELSACRIAQSENPKEAAALKFAQSIVLNRGQVGPAALAEIREAGYSDAQLIEILGVTVVTSLLNYVNRMFDTPIDFPIVFVNHLPTNV